MKYFVDGYSPSFALVDSFTRAIWFVLDDEQLAHTLAEVFSGKLSLLVFDLRTFTNVDIDNHVCLNWEIPEITNVIIVRPGPSVESKSTTFTANNTVSHKLINKSVILHPQEMQQELQQQLMFAYRILSKAQSGDIKNIISVELSLHEIEDKLFKLASSNVTAANCEMSQVLGILNKLYE